MSLSKLIEAVEAGVISTDLIMDALEEPVDQVTCLAAFDGYVEAGPALAASVLPDWTWTMHSNGQAALWPPGTVDGQNAGVIEAEADGLPSRALLLCILRALEQEGR
ncbi:hypothetical protein [Tabrizicola sp. M-4]|uniref:hypothetical protein n=1 Tax=Tabrizicola sp. M-4 TaxID=3055847 RepID=UPI003DA9D91C